MTWGLIELVSIAITVLLICYCAGVITGYLIWGRRKSAGAFDLA